MLDQYIGTIDAFSKYDNVLAYNVGNEVITAPAGTGAAAFIKAAARDVRSYLSVTSPTFPSRRMLTVDIRDPQHLHLLVSARWLRRPGR